MNDNERFIDMFCHCDGDVDCAGDCECTRRVKFILKTIFYIVIIILLNNFGFLGGGNGKSSSNEEVNELKLQIKELEGLNKKLISINYETQEMIRNLNLTCPQSGSVVEYKPHNIIEKMKRIERDERRYTPQSKPYIQNNNSYSNISTPTPTNTPSYNPPVDYPTKTPTITPSVDTPEDDPVDTPDGFSGIDYPFDDTVDTPDNTTTDDIDDTVDTPDNTTTDDTTIPTTDPTDEVDKDEEEEKIEDNNILSGYKQVVFANNTVSCQSVKNGGCVSHKRNVEIWIKDTLPIINSAYSTSMKALHIDNFGSSQEDFIIITHPSYVNNSSMIIKIEGSDYIEVPPSNFYTLTDTNYEVIQIN